MTKPHLAILCILAAATFTSFAAEKEKVFTAEDKSHWAFQKVVRPSVPSAPKGTNSIDAFIDAKLKEKGLVRNAPAERRTWLRRASLDLLGLPPSPDEVEAFLKDQS